MKINLKYQFVPGTQLEQNDDGSWVLRTPIGEYPILSEVGVLEKTLQRLIEAPLTEEEIIQHFIADNGMEELALIYYFLEQMRPSRILEMKIGEAEDPLAALVPQTMLFKLKVIQPEEGKSYQMSRFAFSRRYNGEMRLESSIAYGCFTVCSKEFAGFVHRLHEPLVISDFLKDKSSDLAELAALLLGLGYLTEVDADGQTKEDLDGNLDTWEFHDLLFHSRSRMGRHDYPAGATFPYKGIKEPLPAVKKMPDHLPTIPLYKPEIEELMKSDPPFSLVMEARRSIREHGSKPITVKQLGEFLFRTARVRLIQLRDEVEERLYDISNRPYPNGGASYELELYLTVNECDGLERGIYHYDPVEHVLRQVQKDGIYVQYLIHDAWLSAAKLGTPQVLITYAPRFQRLSWKYRGMGYSASLKNVGALYQSMYLVATVMGLAPCALGNGNAELFCKATGNDYYQESSTAEFMLGSMPPYPAQGHEKS